MDRKRELEGPTDKHSWVFSLRCTSLSSAGPWLQKPQICGKVENRKVGLSSLQFFLWLDQSLVFIALA